MSSTTELNPTGDATLYDQPGFGVAPLSTGWLSWSDHRYGWRDRLLHFLHNRYVHIFLIALLILDVFLVIAGIAVEIEFLDTEIHDLEVLIEELIENPDEAETIQEEAMEVGNLRLEEAEEGLAYASLAILFVFLLENILLMIGLGHRYFLSFFHVFDLAVVSASIALEFVLQGSPEGGLLILARTWRFARIAHGLYETTVSEEERKISATCKTHKAELRSIDDRLRSTGDDNLNQQLVEIIETDASLMNKMLLQFSALAKNKGDDGNSKADKQKPVEQESTLTLQ